MKTPQKDSIVFSRSGQRARFIAEVDGEFFVRPEIEIQGWEGEVETDWGDTVTWHEIFPKAPTEVLDKEILEKEKGLEELKNKARLIHSKITEGETLMREQKEKFARYEALKYLEDFIDKKITHVVYFDYYWDDIYHGCRILPFNDVAKDDDNNYYRDRFKLISLYGQTNGNLTWNIHRYSDGSGNSKSVIIPCKSREEAVSEIQKLVDRAAESLKLGEENKIRRDFIDSARKAGAIIPENISKYFEQQDQEERARRLQKAKEKLIEVQKEVAELEKAVE